MIINTNFIVDKIHEMVSIFPTSSTWNVLINICVRTELGQGWNRTLGLATISVQFCCALQLLHVNYVYSMVHPNSPTPAKAVAQDLKWSNLPSWESTAVHLLYLKKIKQNKKWSGQFPCVSVGINCISHWH